MEEKKSIQISLVSVLLFFAIIIIIAMGYCIYKLYTDKAAEIQKNADLQAQVEKLTSLNSNTPSTESSTNKTNIQDTQKNYDNIILNGNYTPGEAGDEVWTFSNDGKISHTSVISNYKGTYKTTGNNIIEIHFTEEERDDLDNPPAKNTYTIDEYSYIYVEDNNTLKIVNSNQLLHKTEI